MSMFLLRNIATNEIVGFSSARENLENISVYFDTSIEQTDENIISINGKFYKESEIPEPTQEEIEAQLQKHYTAIIQSILDVEAQKLGYDNCNSVCTYVDTGVQKFDDEGIAFRKWRSAIWAKGYEILADVQSGKMEIPSETELIEILPKLEIIYTE